MDLITEILRGMRDTADARDYQYDADEILLKQTNWASTVNCLYLTLNSIAVPSTNFQDTKIRLRYLDGSTKNMTFDQLKFKDVYNDDYTGQPMHHRLTQEAIVNEIVYFADKVWRLTTRDHAETLPDAKVIGGMWVMTNKGDEEAPKIRCRYVATEVNLQGDVSFYAATPPLEAKKLLFSQFARRRTQNGKILKLSLIDVTKA